MCQFRVSKATFNRHRRRDRVPRRTGDGFRFLAGMFSDFFRNRAISACAFASSAFTLSQSERTWIESARDGGVQAAS